MSIDDGKRATRVFATVTRKSPYWSSALSTTETFLSTATKHLESLNMIHSLGEHNSSLRLLVKQVWRHAIQLVFDVSNTSYDAALAHLPEHNNLPVISVHFGRGDVRAVNANPGVRQRVNVETANAHNLNGEQSVPPFVEDHTRGDTPVYLAPRNPSIL